MGALILLLLIFPGIFLFYLGKDLIKSITYMIAISLSFWIISAWFLKLFNFSFFLFFYIILFLSLFLFVINIKKIKVRYNKIDLLILFMFLIILVLRIIPFFDLIVAPGVGDITFHSSTTRLIVENKGLPDSYEPILPIKYFGTYAAGFHTISALISLIGDIPAYRATFILSCIIYFLIHLALYIFIRNYFNRKVSFIVSIIALFLTTYPQLIFHWGGNSTSFSFFFIIIAMTMFKGVSKKFMIRKYILIPLVLVASLLTHVNPFLTFFYVYGFYLLILFLINKRLTIIKNIFFIVFISFLLLSPYLINFKLGFSESEREEFKHKFYDHSVFFKDKISNLISMIILGPIQAIAFTGFLFFFVASIGFFILIFKNYKLAISCLIFFIGTHLLLINAKYMFLPFSFALMTDRISLFFFFSLCICAAVFVDFLFKKINWKILTIMLIGYFVLSFIYLSSFNELNFYNSPYNVDRTKINLKQGLDLVTFQIFGGVFYLYTFGMDLDSLITKADLEAFEWIEKNTKKDDLFLNDDSGMWIPAIVYRPIINPHIPTNYHNELFEAYNLNPFYRKEYNLTTIITVEFNKDLFISDVNNLKERNIKYVYIGKRYFKKRSLESEMFENKNYLKVYDKEVKIYKVVY